MRTTIVISVDDVKDKTLIDWVNSKTNKSAFLRFILYDYKARETNGLLLPPPPTQGLILNNSDSTSIKEEELKNDEELDILKGLINSLELS